MLGIAVQIMGEFMDGVIGRLLYEKPLGPYSEGWSRKVFNENSAPVHLTRVKKKLATHYLKEHPDELQKRYTEWDFQSAPIRSPLPDLTVDCIEQTEGIVAPLVFYFLRDISRPVDLENWEQTERCPSKLFQAFPYCHWWQCDESIIEAGQLTVEMAVDACLAVFVCLFIDTELQMDLDEAIEKFLLPGISTSYSSKYAVSHYVDYRAECIKAHPNASLEKFYREWADSEGHGDRDRMEKRLKKWRNKKNPVQPSLRLFGDFVYHLTDGSFRSINAEFEIVGLFLIVQMIQRYRGQKNGRSKILGPETFYRDRVHFWYDKITGQYSDVLARRSVERESKKSDPS